MSSTEKTAGSTPGLERVWPLLPWVVILGLLIRIAVAAFTDSINQSDEHFQYLEQAHRLVYHYGIVPWEYRFGIRSWALPFLIGAILYLCNLFGLDSPAQYSLVIKIVFCIISTTLVLSVYFIGRRLFSETIGRIAALLVAVWWELVYFAYKPTPEVLSAYAFFAVVCFALAEPRWRSAMLVGVLSGFVVGLRIQNGIMLVPVAVWMLARWPLQLSVASAAAFLIALAGFGWLDYLTWSVWFGSFRQNVLFNGVHDVASLFGAQPIWFYAVALTVASGGLVGLGGIGLILRWKQAWLLILSALLLLGAHMLVPHKEYRFIVALIPAWLIGLAILVAGLHPRKPWLARATFVGFLIVSTAGLADRLPLQGKVYKTAPITRSDAVAAYRLIATTPDLVSVYDETQPWYKSPGYFGLHVDVPLYFAGAFDKAVSPADYVQFWLRKLGAPSPGASYSLWSTVGDLSIWRRTGPVMPLPGYTRSACQRGVDDVFVATVVPTIPTPTTCLWLTLPPASTEP